MKRPEQHITETKSQRIFEQIVPVEWVCREIKPDYGVDYLIEIFDDNKSTGKTFFVQLKGSSQDISNDTFEKQFTVDNLQYYKSLSLPVLIVCVSVKTKKIWGIWANNLLESKKIENTQKSIKISLNKNYLLNEEILLETASKLEMTNKIGLSVDMDMPIQKAFNDHIIKWIENYYSKVVSVRFNHLPNHLELNYKSDESNNLLLEIKTPIYSKELKFMGLTEEEDFLYKPLFDDNEINKFNIKVLFHLAIALANYDVTSSIKILIKVISEVEMINIKELNSIDPVGLLSLAKVQNSIGLFDKFVEKAIENKLFDLFFLCDLAYFSIDSVNLKEPRIKNLNRIIESNSDGSLLGTCYYNLGNIFRREMLINEALTYYSKARKLQPDYLNRSYWWREVAGLLFSKKHYTWAEYSYKKSIEFQEKIKSEVKYFRMEIPSPKEENIINALIADCLFFQGKFKEANIYFEKYFEYSCSNSQEWILKNIICLDLMNSELNNVEINRTESLRVCEEGIKLESNESKIQKLKTAIKLNPTNGLAWYNLGVVQDKVGNHDESLFSFVVTGLLQEWDKEAQFNALIIAFTTHNFNMLQTIFHYLFQKHGELIMNELVEYIMKKKTSLKNRKHLVDAFNNIFNIIKTLD